MSHTFKEVMFMKTLIEIIPHHYHYDRTLSREDNALLASGTAMTDSEVLRLISEIDSVFAYCHCRFEYTAFPNPTYTGEFPEDVIYMVEDILGRYCNDDLDKLDYCICEQFKF